MLSAISLIDRSLNRLGKVLLANQRPAVDRYRIAYMRLDDHGLRQLCQEALQGRITENGTDRSASGILVQLLDLFKLRLRTSAISLKHLALAIEVFQRAPADLEAGSKLYPEQRDAAVALMQRFVVQMDTGEGKTYALLPAAFALACKYGKVYIICANEYLAWRDAERTKPFWEFIGITPGFCSEGTNPSEWSHIIIYTTLQCILFKSLNDDISCISQTYPISYSALILDEIDATLLDESLQSFTLVRYLRSTAFDWARAVEIAGKLVEKEHIVVDLSNLSATLTADGEALVRKQLEVGTSGIVNYFLLRHAVESAYIADHIVKEGEDYIIEGDRVQPIDRVTGRVERHKVFPWVLPLEYARGVPPRPKSVTVHERSTIVFLNEFEHISGLSGTIAEDSFEYLYIHQICPLVIQPRFPRKQHVFPDLIFRARQEAIECLCSEVVGAIEANRPVLIGTQTIDDAEDVYRSLRETMPQTVDLRLLTGRNEREIAEVLKGAGQVGSIIVATQLAGRGVDIRLSDEARANNGMALFCLGHAQELRYDLQFLGRVGRQGDPFSARFICSLEDTFFRRIAANWVGDLLEKLGQEKDEAIESDMVDKRIRAAQVLLRRGRLIDRMSQYHINQANIDVNYSIKDWFDYLQIVDELRGVHQCADAFLGWVIHHYIQGPLEPILGQSTEISREIAAEVVEAMRSTLDLKEAFLEPLDLEGCDAETARRIIRNSLEKALKTAFQKNEDYRAEIEARHRDPLEAQYLINLSNISNELYSLYGPAKIRLLELLTQSENSPLDGPSNGPATDNGKQLSPAGAEPVLVPETVSNWDDVEQFRNAALSLRNQLEASCSAEGLRRAVDRVEAILQLIVELICEYNADLLVLRRTPRNVALCSIHTAWMEFLEERSRLIHRIGNMGMSYQETHRMTHDGIIKEWDRVESDLSSRVLHNLLQCDQPGRLDDLFILQDYAETSIETENLTDYGWKSSPADRESSGFHRETSLIEQFVEENKESLIFGSLNESKLKNLLLRFLKTSPLSSLRSPDLIVDALENWFRMDLAHGAPHQRAKLHRRWIWKFLEFLNQRRLVGKLPSFRNWFLSGARQFTKSLSERGTILTLAGALAFVGVFVLLSAYGTVAEPKRFEGLGRIVNYILFGDLLNRGVITAPAMAALILGSLAVAVLQPWAVDRIKGFGIDRLVVPLFQIGFAWWITSWHFSPLGLARSVGVFTGIWALAWATQRVVWILYTFTGVSLEAAWLAYTTSLVLLPKAVSWSNANGLRVMAVVTGVAAVSYAWKQFNSREIVLHSVHLGESPDMTRATEVTTCRRVFGDCGSACHIFAFLFSWMAYEFGMLLMRRRSTPQPLTGPALSLFSISIYLSIEFVWCWWVLSQRFSFSHWRSMLNTQRQMFEGVTSDAGLSARLWEIRKALLISEVGFQAAVVLIVTIAFAGLVLPPQGYPASLLFLFATFLFVEKLDEFGHQLYKFLVSRAPVTHKVIDLSQVPEPQIEQGVFEKISGFLKNATAFAGFLWCLMQFVKAILPFFIYK